MSVEETTAPLPTRFGPRMELLGALDDLELGFEQPRSLRLVTRVIDVVGAATLLLVLLPLLGLIALAVRLSSPGPVLFRQTRVGEGRRPFEMLKFRSMYAGSDDRAHRAYVTSMLSGERAAPRQPGGLFKLGDDPRVTAVGSVLRRTSLDELPQLVNVLRGEMSLVGPRPALAWEVGMYKPHHLLRFEVKPGLTGLWQVSGRNHLSMSQALDIDVEYVRRRSLRLDLWILALTLPVVVRCDGVR